MNVSNVKAVITELWDFVWPPFLLIMLILATTRYVAPTFSEQCLRHLIVSPIVMNEQTRNTLEFYGFAKLIPAMLLFTFFFTIYITGRICDFVGDILPGSIYISPDILLSTVDQNRLQAIVKRFTDCTSTHHLWSEIEEFIAQLEDKSPYAGFVKYYEQQWKQYGSLFSRCKFFLLWIVILTVAEFRYSPKATFPGHALIAVAITLVVLGFAMYMYLYMWDQYVIVSVDAALLKPTTEHTSASHVKVISTSHSPGSHWHISFAPKFVSNMAHTRRILGLPSPGSTYFQVEAVQPEPDSQSRGAAE